MPIITDFYNLVSYFLFKMAFSKPSRHPNCQQKHLEIGHCGACKTHFSPFCLIATTEELRLAPLPSFAYRILLRWQIIFQRTGPIESFVGDLHYLLMNISWLHF